MLRTLKDFDPRNNSIGMLRFMCAMLVLVSHGYGLGGFNPGTEPLVALSHNQWSLGTVAVCSFFFLSGFLVTRSYLSLDDAVRFLWHRILRIFPAYWLCLIITAFGFGGVLYYAVHGSFSGFLNPSAENSPWGFLTNNYTLDVYQFDVLHLVANIPYKLGLNGSLWTLGNEFRCYIALAVLGLIGILSRARVVVLVTLVALWIVSAWPPAFPQFVAAFPPLGRAFEQTYAFEEMAVFFFAGSAAFLYAGMIPVRTIPAFVALVVAIAAFPFPWFRVTIPLLLSYALIWIVMQRPVFRFSRGADYSYGIYLYAFPASQCLTFFHMNQFGFPAYLLLTTLVTTAIAAVSWHLLEKPALSLKSVPFPSWLRLSTPAPILGFLTTAGERTSQSVSSSFASVARVRRRVFTRVPARWTSFDVFGGSLGRIATLSGIAIVAYVTAMLVIFPHYIAPLAAHHSDMYIAPDLAAHPHSLGNLLRAPRPVIWIVEQYGGYLGLEGSVAAFLVLAILDLVLALFILERYFLRRRIPIWLSYLTFCFAMSAPGFYINAGYDIGTALGMFFGFLGIVVWEERGDRLVLAGIGAAALFALSALSKEGFVPVLFVYAIVRAWQAKRAIDRVVLLLPAFAAMCLVLDAKVVNSVFVNVSHGSDSPYYVSFSPDAILGSLQYYFEPYATPLVIGFIVLAFVASWIAHRGKLALCIFVSALSLQAPYLILPNHRLGYYWWVTIPILMLLVPVALLPAVSSTSPANESRSKYRRGSFVAALCVLVFAIAQFAPTDAADESWFLTQQQINDSVMRGLRSERVKIDKSPRVLVVGLSFPFHPWSHAGFVSRDLNFSGEWTVATEPGAPPIPDQRSASAINYGDVRFTNYDLVLVFNPLGHIVGAYTPAEVQAVAKERGLGKNDASAFVASIRSEPVPEGKPSETVALAAPASAPVAAQIVYPPDMLDEKKMPPKGIYPPDGPTCCWAAADSQFEVDDPANAKSIVLRVYIPSNVPSTAAPTNLVMLSSRGKSVGQAAIGLGFHDVTFNIPAGSLSGGKATIRLHSDRSFVPHDLGLNGDPRQLSFLLVSAHLR